MKVQRVLIQDIKHYLSARATGILQIHHRCLSARYCSSEVDLILKSVHMGTLKEILGLQLKTLRKY